MNALGGVIFDTRTHNKRFQRIKENVIKIHQKLNYTNVTFPVTQKGYRKIEIMNSIDINVFGYEIQEPYPVYISKEKFSDMLNLL